MEIPPPGTISPLPNATRVPGCSRCLDPIPPIRGDMLTRRFPACFLSVKAVSGHVSVLSSIISWPSGTSWFSKVFESSGGSGASVGSAAPGASVALGTSAGNSPSPETTERRLTTGTEDATKTEDVGTGGTVLSAKRFSSTTATSAPPSTSVEGSRNRGVTKRAIEAAAINAPAQTTILPKRRRLSRGISIFASNHSQSPSGRGTCSSANLVLSISSQPSIILSLSNIVQP